MNCGESFCDANGLLFMMCQIGLDTCSMVRCEQKAKQVRQRRPLEKQQDEAVLQLWLAQDLTNPIRSEE